MPLCRHRVGTYQELGNGLTRNSSGKTRPQSSQPKEWNKFGQGRFKMLVNVCWDDIYLFLRVSDRVRSLSDISPELLNHFILPNLV